MRIRVCLGNMKLGRSEIEELTNSLVPASLQCTILCTISSIRYQQVSCGHERARVCLILYPLSYSSLGLCPLHPDLSFASGLLTQQNTS
ncbi:hypothetical protein KQX54_004353 [Cotesia glomerata]|uniref:Uncharacterized protein n=1 Tax=Cotesia glomerata TaxID=32391 RepID=A0AAV7IPS5_COTGL|nr:hypothetical protein KQX54_004353 [Cotesia glomerata]